MMDETTIKQMVKEAMALEERTRRPLFRRFPEAIEADIRCAAEGHPGYGPHGCTRCFAARPRDFEPSEPVIGLRASAFSRSAHRPGSDPADCEQYPGERCSCWD